MVDAHSGTWAEVREWASARLSDHMRKLRKAPAEQVPAIQARISELIELMNLERPPSAAQYEVASTFAIANLKTTE